MCMCACACVCVRAYMLQHLSVLEPTSIAAPRTASKYHSHHAMQCGALQVDSILDLGHKDRAYKPRLALDAAADAGEGGIGWADVSPLSLRVKEGRMQ